MPDQMKKIEVFRTSPNHPHLDKAAVKACADAYDYDAHSAPICIGHPVDDAPAYGYVHTLEYEDCGEYGSLSAVVSQIDDDFAELVNVGRYNQRSASFYRPTDDNNPTPNVYGLRHIAFLGAQPPLIKGMKRVSFKEGDTNPLKIEFADYSTTTQQPRDQKMKDDKPTNTMPMNTMTANEQAMATDMDKMKVAMKKMQDDMFIREGALKVKEDEMKTMMDSYNMKMKETAKAGTVSFVEKMITEGRLLPKDKDVTISTIEGLKSLSTKTHFSEDDGTISTITLAEDYCRKLSGVEPIVDFGEVAGGQNTAGDNAGKNGLLDPTVDKLPATGIKFSRDSFISKAGLDEDAKILAFAEKHDVPYLEALTHINR